MSKSGKDVHTLTLSTQHFLRRPRRRPCPEGALKDGFGEAVVSCDMPERKSVKECTTMRFRAPHQKGDACNTSERGHLLWRAVRSSSPYLRNSI